MTKSLKLYTPLNFKSKIHLISGFSNKLSSKKYTFFKIYTKSYLIGWVARCYFGNSARNGVKVTKKIDTIKCLL